MGGLKQNGDGAIDQAPAGISPDDRAATYGAALGQLFDATCVIDPGLNVLDCDRGFLKLLDRPEGEVLGQPLPTLNLTGSLDGEPVTLQAPCQEPGW